MKPRVTYLAALAASAILSMSSAPARAGVSMDVMISFGNENAGGTLVYRSEPEVVLVPATKVYYVRNYDCNLYRYGRYWYFIEKNRWYRARDYSGPFVRVQTRSVPRSVVTVPVNYRRNWHGPPPHAKAWGYGKHHKHGRGEVAQGHHKDKGSHKEKGHGTYNKHDKDNGHGDDEVAQGQHKEKGHGKNGKD